MEIIEKKQKITPVIFLTCKNLSIIYIPRTKMVSNTTLKGTQGGYLK